jgi:hypothetical protein
VDEGMMVVLLVLVSEQMMLVGQHSAVAIAPTQTHDTVKWVIVISGLVISNTIPVPVNPMTQTLWFLPYPCYSLPLSLTANVSRGVLVSFSTTTGTTPPPLAANVGGFSFCSQQLQAASSPSLSTNTSGGGALVPFSVTTGSTLPPSLQM